jgi:hypothetical protein
MLVVQRSILTSAYVPDMHLAHSFVAQIAPILSPSLVRFRRPVWSAIRRTVPNGAHIALEAQKSRKLNPRAEAALYGGFIESSILLSRVDDKFSPTTFTELMINLIQRSSAFAKKLAPFMESLWEELPAEMAGDLWVLRAYAKAAEGLKEELATEQSTSEKIDNAKDNITDTDPHGQI